MEEKRYIHLFEAESEFQDEYNGEEYHEPWVSYTRETKDVEYNKEREPMVVALTLSDCTVGEDTEVVATLPDDATGSVTFYVDGVFQSEEDIVEPRVIFHYTPVSPGIYTVSVDYSGDNKYLPGYVEGEFNVVEPEG